MVNMKEIELDFGHFMPNFKTLFNKVIKTYKRNSGFKGKISINKGDFSDNESGFFNMFMNKRPHSRKNTYQGVGVNSSQKVAILEIKKAFECRYEHKNLNFLDFLEYINGGKIVVKSEIDSRMSRIKKEKIVRLKEVNEDFVPLFLNSYLRDESLIDDLIMLNQVVSNLPCELINISFFANDLFSDPHALDGGTRLARLLEIYMFSIYKKDERLSDTENIRNAYEYFNLRKDDISSIVYSYNITNHTPPWDYLNERKRIKASTLNELYDVDVLYPVNGQAVIIIENNNVFNNLTRDFPDLSFICGSGQFTSAVWRMLRSLSKESKIYYSGDIDKNGIMIADQLEDKLGVEIHYLAMSEDVYFENKKHSYAFESDVSVRVKSPSLQRQAKLINIANAHVYQETVYERLVSEIKREIIEKDNL